MRKAIDAIDVEKTELEVATEALSEMMKKGAENPHIHVTTGPKPRVHAEPRNWVKIKPTDTVEIVLSADYNGYYSNLTRTVFLGGLPAEKQKAFEVFMEVHQVAEENLKTGTQLIEIEKLLRKLIGVETKRDILYDAVAKAHHSYPCTATMGMDSEVKEPILHIGGYIVREEVEKALKQAKAPQ